MAILLDLATNKLLLIDLTGVPVSDLAAATADVDFGNHKGVNVADPSLDQDAATKKYHDDHKYTNAEAIAALQNTEPTFATCKVSNLDAGEIVFPDAVHKLITDDNLFWDNVNKRLGIGTKTPGHAIHCSPTTSVFKIYGQTAANSRANLIIGQEIAGGHYAYLGYHGSSFTNDWGYPDVYGPNRTIFQGSGGGFVIVAYFGSFIRFAVNYIVKLDITDTGLGVLTKDPTCALDINSNKIRLRTPKTPPSCVSPGNQGDICWDSFYIYVCTTNNAWKRSALTVW